MTEPVRPPAPDDPSFESLLAECIDRCERGDEAGIAEVLARVPALALRLRAQLGVLRESGLLAPQPGAKDGLGAIGDFRLLRCLGSGGMGVVYLAQQTSLGREVAVKLMRADAILFPDARARFRREIEAAARLQHPGIATIHAVEEIDGIPLYAMEYVRGCSLGDALHDLRGREPATLRGADLWAAVCRRTGDRPAAMPPLFDADLVTTAFRIAERLATAIAHAHDRGVHHRDLKPSNAMLTPDGRVVLVDFGLATTVGQTQLTAVGAQLGSLHYMSPEQVAARPTDARTDVYGLGITLFEMLTLALPYRSPSVDRTQQLILAGHIPPLRQHNPAVPRDAELVCRTAMDRDPDRRYQTAAALVADLQAFLRHEPIAARPLGPALRLRRYGQRHPVVAAVTALLLLATLLVPSILAWLVARERDDAVAARDETARLRAGERALLYQASLAAAVMAQAQGDERGAREHLDACPAELRAFEWGHLRRHSGLARLELPLQAGEWPPVWTEDGSSFVVQEHDRVTAVAALDGALRGSVPLPARGRCAMVAADHDAVLVWGADDHLRRYRRQDLRELQDLGQWPGPADAALVEAAAHGLFLAVGNDDQLRAYDLATAAPRWAVAAPTRVSTFYFPLTGQPTLLTRDGESQVVGIGLADGSITPTGMRVDHSALAIHPDGARAASISRDGELQLRRLADGAVLARNPAGLQAPMLTFDHTGRQLAAGTQDGRVSLFEVPGLERQLTWPAGDGVPLWLSFGPDDQELLVGLRDGGVRVFQLARCGETVTVAEPPPGFIDGTFGDHGRALAFHPDGRLLAEGGESGAIRIVDVATGRTAATLFGHRRRVTGLAFTADGNQLCSSADDGRLCLWDWRQDRCEPLVLPPPGFDLLHEQDGRLLLARSPGDVAVVDLGTRRCRWLQPHGESHGTPLLAAFTRAGDVLLRWVDGRLAVHAADDGRQLAVADDAVPLRQAGRLAADEEPLPARASVRAVLDGLQAESRHAPVGQSGIDLDLIASPDGERLFTSSLGGVVRVHDGRSGKLLLSLGARDSGVAALACATAGRGLAASTYHGRVLLWPTTSTPVPTAAANAARATLARLGPALEHHLTRWLTVAAAIAHLDEAEPALADPGVRPLATEWFRARGRDPQRLLAEFRRSLYSIRRVPAEDELALRSLQAGLELQPDDAELQLGTGLLLLRKKDLAAARPHLERARDLAGADGSPRALFALALLLSRSGETAAAEASLRAGQELMARPLHANDKVGKGFAETTQRLLAATGK